MYTGLKRISDIMRDCWTCAVISKPWACHYISDMVMVQLVCLAILVSELPLKKQFSESRTRKLLPSVFASDPRCNLEHAQDLEAWNFSDGRIQNYLCLERILSAIFKNMTACSDPHVGTKKECSTAKINKVWNVCGISQKKGGDL